MPLPVTVAALVATSLLASAVAAQGFPNRPIRFIAVGPAGGGTDLLARQIGQKLHDAWGQPVLVENRAGAGGNIGYEHVAKSPPDGYTLLLAYTSLVINPAVYAKPLYDPVKDFAPVAHFVNFPNMVATNPRVPARTLKELITMARSRPGMLTYSSAGIGSGGHLGGELLKTMANISLTHIPFKGTAPALTETIGGQVDMIFTALQNLVAQVKAGKLRGIGMGGQKRTQVFPDIPTVAESLPGYESVTLYGVLAPAGTPREIVDKINGAINAALSTGELRERFERDGGEVLNGTPEQFAAKIRTDLPKYAKLVKLAGAKED